MYEKLSYKGFVSAPKNTQSNIAGAFKVLD